MKKRLLALMLVVAMVMGMSMTTLAEGEPTDTATVNIKKVYKLVGEGSNPAEDFEFENLECVSVTNAHEGVTKDNAPLPHFAKASFAKAAATTEGYEGTATVTLPGVLETFQAAPLEGRYESYPSVGVYTYTFNEKDAGTAGVTYYDDPMKLVVTVIQDGDNGKLRIAGVHCESEDGNKTDSFENIYSAGKLSVSKEVTGNLADRDLYFDVKVTFNAPAGDIVKESIIVSTNTSALGVADANTKLSASPEAGWSGTKEVIIQVKHGDTVDFANIPYGVTYSVVETTPGDYTDTYSLNGAEPTETSISNENMNQAAETVVITNAKSDQVDTGIILNNMPYILALIVVAFAAVVLFRRKREF